MADYKSKKKLTVLMPVFNEQRYLKSAINSILNQTYSFFEFIIINDGSTDNSESIILSFNDDRIVYKSNIKNLGLIETLNLGIQLSNCEYIARMDADDVSHKARLEKQFNFLESKREFSAVGSFFRCIDAKGRLSEDIRWPTDLKKILYSGVTGFCPLGHPGTMYKKKAILDVGCYDKNYFACEDYELWLKLLANGYKLINLPEYLLDYRIHKSQVTNTHREIQLRNHAKAFQSFYQKLTNKQIRLNCATNYINLFSFNYQIKNNHLSQILEIYNDLITKILEIHILKDQRSYFDSLVINFVGKNLTNLGLYNILKSILKSNIPLFNILRPLLMILKVKADFFFKKK